MAHSTGRWLACMTFVVVSVLNCLARAEDAPSPTPPISIQMTGVHPREALEEFTRLTGMSFRFSPEQLYERGRTGKLPGSIDVNIDQQGFWPALEAICAAAKLNPSSSSEAPGAVILRSAGARSFLGNRPRFDGSNYIVTVNSLYRNDSISFGDGNTEPRRRDSGIAISAYLDPRMGVFKCYDRPAIETAEDENGQAIAPSMPLNQRQSWNNVSCPWFISSMSFPLNYDPQSSRKIAQLKGTIHVALAAETEKVEVSELSRAKGVEKEIGGMKLTVDELTETDATFRIKLSIARNDVAREQFELACRNMRSAVQFFNAEGKLLLLPNSGGGSSTADLVIFSVEMRFADELARPAKLVLRVPTRTEEVDLPFEFHDLELP